MTEDQRDRKSVLAVNLGLGINILLAAVKTSVGVLGHSPALLAEGINSTSDVVYYVAASILVRMANKPADHDHPYGHRQFESVASVLIGSFIVVTGVAVFWDALEKVWGLFDGELTSKGANLLALWVALATVGIKIFLFTYVRGLGRETKNPIVEALAQDHRNDLFSASAASAGIFLGRHGYPWVDPLAGALVALLIIRTGIYILQESSIDLMGTVPHREMVEEVSELLKKIKGVKQLQELQAHRFGPQVVINLTIGIDGSISVHDGDAIANCVEGELIHSIPNVMRVHVHYHPADQSHENMTIDDILAEPKKQAELYQPKYYK